MDKFFLDLGRQPLANSFLTKFSPKQTKYNLKLYFNTKTKMVSISKRIPSSVMFNSKYPYRSSMSLTMQSSFKKLSDEIKKRFNPNLLLEIGSNDGALIKNFDKNKVIGVEPCKNLAKITKKIDYKTFDKYWDFKLAKKIKREFKSVDVIYSANTITHISNLDNVFKSICHILAENGVVIIEDPSLLQCLKKNSYDQFYNEHIYLFSTLSVRNLLSKFSLEIFDIKNLKTHGGSLRYYIKRKKNKKIKISKNLKKQINRELKAGLDNFSTYKNFTNRVTKSKQRILKILNNIKEKNKKVLGYGATAKAVTVLNYCNINSDLIQNFTDTTPEKINRYMPGKKIKILQYKKNLLKNFDYVFLGAWNFKKEIINKESKFIKKGLKFITHIPTPKILKLK